MEGLVLADNKCESCGGDIWRKPKRDGTPRKARLCTRWKCKRDRITTIDASCYRCGKVFQKAKHARTKYCSRSCSHKTTIGWLTLEAAVRRIERDSIDWIIEKSGKRRKAHALECIECGTTYRTTLKTSNCCSKACSTKRAADATKVIRATDQAITVRAEVSALKRIACRQKQPSKIKQCISCGKHHNRLAVCCSDECAYEQVTQKIERERGTTKCRCCDAEYSRLYGFRMDFCSSECRVTVLKETSRRHKAARSAHERGAMPGGQRFDPFEVFRRDEWKCKACGCDTPERLRGANEHDSPELDHIVPLSRGGWHAPDNCQTLCRQCNQDKGAKLEHEWKHPDSTVQYLF